MTVILKILNSLPRLRKISPCSLRSLLSPPVGPQHFRQNVFHHTAPSAAVNNTSTEEKEKQKLKIMFFGTDQFAVASLKRLFQEYKCEESGSISSLEVTCLHMKSLVPAVTKFSQEKNLNIHIWPPDLDYISQNFDLGVVASFGKLIPSKIIQSFPLGMINVHGSLLPRWRGAAPVIHALKNGDTKTGITIMKVKPHKFDVGEILAKAEIDLDEDICRPELTSRLAEVGADLLVEVIRDFTEYNQKCVKQDEADMTLAPLIDKSIADLDWTNLTNMEVFNLWRAVGDLTKLNTKYLETGFNVRIATVLHPRCLIGADLDNCADPGTVVFIRRSKRDRYVCVKCREGWVAVSDIYYHNKKVMKPIDFYNGLLSRPGVHKFI